MHYINYENLYNVVLEDIRAHIKRVNLIALMIQMWDKESNKLIFFTSLLVS